MKFLTIQYHSYTSKSTNSLQQIKIFVNDGQLVAYGTMHDGATQRHHMHICVIHMHHYMTNSFHS